MVGFSMEFKESSAHIHALRNVWQLLNSLSSSVKYALGNLCKICFFGYCYKIGLFFFYTWLVNVATLCLYTCIEERIVKDIVTYI